MLSVERCHTGIPGGTEEQNGNPAEVTYVRFEI